MSGHFLIRQRERRHGPRKITRSKSTRSDLGVVNDSDSRMPSNKTYQGWRQEMALRKRINFRKISGASARKNYLRHYIGLPTALCGSEMDKERFLNTFSENMLDVVGVQPKRTRSLRHLNS